jgi:type I restriction enzyme R subunit
VKKVAESLLELLKRERLVLDWRKEQRTRAAVPVAVKEVLDELPDKFDTDQYERKCEIVYLHVFGGFDFCRLGQDQLPLTRGTPSAEAARSRFAV